MASGAAPVTAAVAPPDDPLFATQWHLPLIQIPEAWKVSTGVGVTVAVLDSGVAFEDYDDGTRAYKKAPGFSRTRFAPGYDFVDGDTHPNDYLGEANADRPGHGTHVAAIIAETTNEGRGAASIAPGATIMPVRVLDWDGNGDEGPISAGIRFAADHGAQVAVTNLTGTDTGAVQAAVRYAAAKGVILVAPSGNSGVGVVDYPASDPDVISVGAVTADKSRASYSNSGKGLDLVAPGGDLREDVTGDGEPDGIRQQTFKHTPNGFCYCQVEGTSSAAPQVAAVAALLVASGLATTTAQVRAALESSALDLGAPGPDEVFGAGLLQAAGALAAAAAVAADLSVSIAPVSASGTAGAPVTTTITVANAGPAAATGVVVTDTLPPGISVTSAAADGGSCTASGGTATCTFGTLAPATSAMMTVVAPPGAGGDASAQAVSVRANQGDGNRTDNSTTNRPPGPPLKPPVGLARAPVGSVGSVGSGGQAVAVVGLGSAAFIAALALAGRRRRRSLRPEEPAG